MGLSAEERRQWRELEQQLAAEDPRLAQLTGNRRIPHRAAGSPAAMIIMLVAFMVLILAVIVKIPLIGILGIILMILGGTRYHLSRREGQLPKTASYLKTLGLPQLGYYILEYLNERSPMLQSELARLVLIRTQTISVVLATLEDNQWITRQHGLSQNQVAVNITEQGRALLAAAQERQRALHLPTDIDVLRPILATIINRATQQPG